MADSMAFHLNAFRFACYRDSLEAILGTCQREARECPEPVNLYYLGYQAGLETALKALREGALGSLVDDRPKTRNRSRVRFRTV